MGIEGTLGVLILIVIACLIVTFVFLLYYVGYFYDMKVSAGPSVVSELQIAYKFHRSNYSACGPFFAELTKLCPELRCLGIYYDDPDKVDPNTCRYVVGVILSDGATEKPDEEKKKLLEKNGFKFCSLPKVDFSVKTNHPFNIPSMCGYIAAKKAYPKLIKYITEEKLSAHPFLELYYDDEVHFMVPLSKQTEFYVEEAQCILKEYEQQG